MIDGMGDKVRGERRVRKRMNRVCNMNGSDHHLHEYCTVLTLSALRECWPRRSLLLTYWLLYWAVLQAISRDAVATVCCSNVVAAARERDAVLVIGIVIR
jgi:hypothetical protein